MLRGSGSKLEYRLKAIETESFITVAFAACGEIPCGRDGPLLEMPLSARLGGAVRSGGLQRPEGRGSRARRVDNALPSGPTGAHPETRHNDADLCRAKWSSRWRIRHQSWLRASMGTGPCARHAWLTEPGASRFNGRVLSRRMSANVWATSVKGAPLRVTSSNLVSKRKVSGRRGRIRPDLTHRSA